MRTTPNRFLYRAPLMALALMLGVLLGATSRAASSSGVDADTRQAILDCTFEVLSQMPASTHQAPRPQTTHHTLPAADLQPTNAFATTSPVQPAVASVRVAGTAFCFGDGQLASAAHVFDQLLGSRFEAPVVRDRRGRVYPVERITRYSTRDDFVVFTVTGLSQLPARAHAPAQEPGEILYLAWRRGDGDIAFGSTQYRGHSTVAELGREGWIQFSPAPGHGASGAALLDGGGRVVALINNRSSERANAIGYAVPIGQLDTASTDWADIAARDPMRALGMPSERNHPLEGGIPLPATYARFEQHMREVRRTYFAHMLPYSLSLSGEGAPMTDAQRASLCAALEPGYCAEANDAAVTHARRDDRSRGCAVTWNAVGAALVRCRTRPGASAARMIDNVRAQISTASVARPFTQAPPAPCTNRDPLESIAAADSFTDPLGATWQVRAWPVQACDWVVLSMSRALPDGTLTLVRGAPSAYAEVATMQLKALVSIHCADCGMPNTQDAVLARMRSTQGEISR